MSTETRIGYTCVSGRLRRSEFSSLRERELDPSQGVAVAVRRSSFALFASVVYASQNAPSV